MRSTKLLALLLLTAVSVPVVPAITEGSGPYVFRFKHSGDITILNEARMEIPDLYVGESFRLEGSTDGGFGALTWTSTGASLPRGVTLSHRGVLSGVPLETGTYQQIEFTVNDATGASTVYGPVTVDVLAPVEAADAVAHLVQGAHGDVDVVVSGGRGPYMMTLETGVLPMGMAVSGLRVAGAPGNVGDFEVGLRIHDSNGRAANAEVTLHAREELVASSDFPDAYIGENYEAGVDASGGEPPYSWFLSGGDLPPGLSVTSEGRVIGSPSAPGTFSFSMRAADAGAQFVSVPGLIDVYSQLAVSPGAPHDANSGIPYGYSFSATGGRGPVTWTVSAGSLPEGLSMSGTGHVHGTPGDVGLSHFTATATDANGRTASNSVTLEVRAVESCSLPWGGTLAHGRSTVGYSSASVPYGSSCSAQTRSCNNGTLSGSSSYSYGSCSVRQPSSCTLSGVTRQHGQSATFYDRSSTAYGTTCSPYAQSRTCNNGRFSGSSAYSHASCSPLPPRNCIAPWGATVLHGQQISAYPYSTMPYGSACVAHQRGCWDGFLGGGGSHRTCVVLPPS